VARLGGRSARQRHDEARRRQGKEAACREKCVCKVPGWEPLRLSVGRPFAVCPDPGHTANNVFAVCPDPRHTAKRLFAVCHDPRHTANKFLLNLNFTQLIRFKKLFYEIKLNDQSKNIAKYSKQLMFYDSNKKNYYFMRFKLYQTNCFHIVFKQIWFNKIYYFCLPKCINIMILMILWEKNIISCGYSSISMYVDMIWFNCKKMKINKWIWKNPKFWQSRI